MTPVELAEMHPQLFHVTAPGAVDRIRRIGLLPTADLLTFLGVPDERRRTLITRRRSKAETFSHPLHGEFIIGDNAPLSDARLSGRLEDGLSFSDYLQILNSRVFFWTDKRRAQGLRESKLNRGVAKELLVIDTLGLASAHADRMEITPFNTGSTGRQPRPPMRGQSTFAPLPTTDYAHWRRRRGQRDRIVEVVVCGGIPDIDSYIREVEPL